MHFVPFLCLAIATFFLGACSRTPNAPLHTVAAVRLNRYTGLWYEIARLPNSFQKNGASATARYTLRADGKVEVLNTETRADGTTKTAKGEASAVNASNNARLKVHFEGLASLIPVSDDGNYWILALTPDYSAALVGTPDRKFLWLLSRTPNLDAATQASFLETARKAGFAVEKLQFDHHLDKPGKTR